MPLGNLRLDDFKDRVGLGTRANRYTVNMIIPGTSESLTAEVAAASLPAAALPSIPVAFRGRILKLPGDRIYGPWQFTLYDSPKNNVSGRTAWKALHDWSNRINNHFSNVTQYDPDDPTFVQDWTISHYELNGEGPLKKMTLHNCWPTLVGDVQLQSGAMDQLVMFNCTVEYEYFTVDA